MIDVDKVRQELLNGKEVVLYLAHGKTIKRMAMRPYKKDPLKIQFTYNSGDWSGNASSVRHKEKYLLWMKSKDYPFHTNYWLAYRDLLLMKA
jgi:hypothetical protein